MSRIKEKRRKYLVNKKLQMQFVWLLVTQSVIPVIVLGTSLYAVNKMYLLRLQVIAGSSIMSDAEIRDILNFSVMSMLTLLVIMVLLLAFLGIRFSHQVAGPLHKLSNSMDGLARGEKVDLISFRKTDILNGIDDKFNAIVKRFGQVK